MARIEYLHICVAIYRILCVRMEITTIVFAMQFSEIWLKIGKRQTFYDMDEMGNNCLYYILSRQYGAFASARHSESAISIAIGKYPLY